MKFKTEISFELLNFNWSIVCLLLGDVCLFVFSHHYTNWEDKNLLTKNVFQNPTFLRKKNVITFKCRVIDLTMNMVTVVSGLSCILSALPSAHLFSTWLLVYLQLCLVIIC